MIDFHQLIRDNGFTNNSASSTQLRRRIDKANQMVADGYSLWGQLMTDTAIGVIQSQSNENKFYFTFIRADGSYGCFDNNFGSCLGQPLYLRPKNRRRRGNHFIEDEEYHFFADNDLWIQHNNRNNDNAFGPRWEYAMPCKHVFSLVNGFCGQADPNVERILRNWISCSFQEFRKPTRDTRYGSFIESQFNPVKERVLTRSVFKPIVDNNNGRFSYYKPSNQVKILDETSFEETILELHVKITKDQIESLPLKNTICISCRQREQNQERLNDWFKCIHCSSQYCQDCYQIFKKEMHNEPCLSALNGYRPHNLEGIKFNEVITRKNTNTVVNKESPTKEVIFRFGDK